MAGSLREYDVIIIGSGSGAGLARYALAEGLRVAVVEKGPLGGTCPNTGCVPSKMLILPADRIVEAQEASRLGVYLRLERVDFAAIMGRMAKRVSDHQARLRQQLLQGGVHLYEQEGRFVGERELQVGGERLRARRVFIAAGARPRLPAIAGLDQVEYLTNESILRLERPPESVIIIGGGYTGCEYAHFLAAMGSEVTILQRPERLLPQEEPEISAALMQRLGSRMAIHVRHQALEVSAAGAGVAVSAKDLGDGSRREFRAERLMIAAGRQSNADLLDVEAAGVRTDERGFIVVDEYMQTSAPGIWAVGDITGREMFIHVANQEARLAWHNSGHAPADRMAMDYGLAPHAVFTYPQIASVGLTEAEARQKHDVLVGIGRYTQVARGEAMLESDGFAKAVVDRESRRILGFHIFGPYAEMLIQEVVTVMAGDARAGSVTSAMHIHPALPEVVVAALRHLEPPAPA